MFKRPHYVSKNENTNDSMNMGYLLQIIQIDNTHMGFVCLFVCLNHIKVPVQHMQAIQGQAEDV